MTTPDPDRPDTPSNPVDAPWWRRVLDLEPALVGTAVRAVIYLVGLLGFVVPSGGADAVVGIFVAVVAAVEAALAIYVRVFSTPTAKVVEQLSPTGTFVVAGPANNQLRAGLLIRAANAPPEPQMTRREYREQHGTD